MQRMTEKQNPPDLDSDPNDGKKNHKWLLIEIGWWMFVLIESAWVIWRLLG